MGRYFSVECREFVKIFTSVTNAVLS